MRQLVTRVGHQRKCEHSIEAHDQVVRFGTLHLVSMNAVSIRIAPRARCMRLRISAKDVVSYTYAASGRLFERGGMALLNSGKDVGLVLRGCPRQLGHFLGGQARPRRSKNGPGPLPQLPTITAMTAASAVLGPRICIVRVRGLVLVDI